MLIKINKFIKGLNKLILTGFLRGLEKYGKVWNLI